jgi:hypothetical protein
MIPERVGVYNPDVDVRLAVITRAARHPLTGLLLASTNVVNEFILVPESVVTSATSNVLVDVRTVVLVAPMNDVGA